MAGDLHVNDDMPAGFMCEVLAVDDAGFEIQKRWGEVVYVRVLRGTLPSRPSSVLVHTESGSSYRTLLGRPHKGEFTPTPATLVMAGKRAYQVTLLASLPALADLRPYLRSGLRPPDDLDLQAVPIALEGLSSSFRPSVQRFRPMGGWLVEGWKPIAGAQTQPKGIPWRRVMAVKDLGRRSDPEAIGTLIGALTDEVEMVRTAAAAALAPLAAQLPVAPFLAMARDTSVLNSAACQVAARVFREHPTEVPVEAVLDLFRDAPDPIVAARAVRAMGRLGDRAPVDVLAYIMRARSLPGPHLYRMVSDLRVFSAAARSLVELGEWAPVEALAKGLDDFWEEVRMEVARALLTHPGPIPDEVRARVQALLDKQTTTRSP